MNENRWLSHRVAPLVLVSLVFLALLPISTTLVNQHPDEFHYHDGGAGMLDSGDWLTPKSGAGKVRLKKPIVPYWMSAVGMAVGGKGVTASRMAHLLMAMGTILVVFSLARSLNCSRQAALLAAAVYGCNILALESAYKAGPDAPLLFFLTLSALGFVNLLTGCGKTRTWQWVAYLGLALAINSKGLLPLVFFGYVVIFAFFWPGLRGRLPDLFPPAPVAVGFCLAVGWFALQGVINGQTLIDQFLGDQITKKARFGPARIGASLVVYINVHLLSFLPWTAILAAAAFRRRSGLRFPMNMATALVIGWTVIVILIFAVSHRSDWRYVLPTFPFVAALIATAIDSIEHDWLTKTTRWFILAFIAAWSVFVVFLTVALGQLTSIPVGLAYLATFGALLVGCWWLAFRKARDSAIYVLACAPLIVLASIAPVIQAMALPDPLEKAVAVLSARNADPPATLFVGPDRKATVIRLYYPGLRTTKRLDSADLDRFDHIVTWFPAVANRLRGYGFEITEERGGWRYATVPTVLGAALRGELRRTARDNAAAIFIASRPGTLPLPVQEGN